jgi:hypothetical protein
VAHLHLFTLADGRNLTTLRRWDGKEPERSLDSAATRLSLLSLGDPFAYVFDLGDDWAHLCTVGTERIDPLDAVGIVPDQPTAYWGWGELPDRYGRRWDGEDGESPRPKQPAHPLVDLPPILPEWGPRRR